jgi:hypothetical protein
MQQSGTLRNLAHFFPHHSDICPFDIHIFASSCPQANQYNYRFRVGCSNLNLTADFLQISQTDPLAAVPDFRATVRLLWEGLFQSGV